MAVTREQFESGMTYAAYKDQMTRNRDQVEQNEKELQLKPEDVQAFRALPETLNVMALAEDWCGDVVANLPILGKLEEASGGKLNVRIHLRDQQPGAQIMDQYLNRGQFKSIPTFVFLDNKFDERGVWIERPSSVTKVREEKRLALYAQHPDSMTLEEGRRSAAQWAREQLEGPIGRRLRTFRIGRLTERPIQPHGPPAPSPLLSFSATVFFRPRGLMSWPGCWVAQLLGTLFSRLVGDGPHAPLL